MTYWIRASILSSLLLTAFAFGPTMRAAEGEEPASADSTERITVGQAAPDFALPDSEGKVYRLSEARDEKRLVLVFFRGAW